MPRRSLPPVEDEETLQAVYAWVDDIPLSRPKRNILRDFADCVMLAEIIHFYRPKSVDLHNYSPANGLKQKMYNWDTLNRRVLKKMGIELPQKVMESVAKGLAPEKAEAPFAIESILLALMNLFDPESAPGYVEPAYNNNHGTPSASGGRDPAANSGGNGDYDVLQSALDDIAGVEPEDLEGDDDMYGGFGSPTQQQLPQSHHTRSPAARRSPAPHGHSNSSSVRGSAGVGGRKGRGSPAPRGGQRKGRGSRGAVAASPHNNSGGNGRAVGGGRGSVSDTIHKKDLEELMEKESIIMEQQDTIALLSRKVEKLEALLKVRDQEIGRLQRRR